MTNHVGVGGTKLMHSVGALWWHIGGKTWATGVCKCKGVMNVHRWKYGVGCGVFGVIMSMTLGRKLCTWYLVERGSTSTRI